MSQNLENIRTRYNLPALGMAAFTAGGAIETAVAGVRKAGTGIAATTDDLWHLGSCTKAMTAALAGSFVAEGRLAWNTQILPFFPETAATVAEGVRQADFGQLLSHRAGLAANLDWPEIGSLADRRRQVAAVALLTPAAMPGEFLYSNAGYTVAGAILERIGGKLWEDLMRERLFVPLGMQSGGFGGTGTPGRIDQPWPHEADGTPVANNGPLADNSPVMAPAGAVHCTMADWARFLIDQLRGAMGHDGLLPAPLYAALHAPPPGGDYACGWDVCERDWAGGKALTHGGSNTLNTCVCWLAPARGMGVLACTNQGGDAAFAACDEAIGLLIQRAA